MKKSIAIILLTTFSVLASAQIIHVPVDQPTIQAAVNAADNGDTVLVDTGTYCENMNFQGKNIVVASNYLITQDTSYVNNTIISYDDFYIPIVSFLNNEDSTAQLCGFTITANESRCSGGYGIECFNSSPVLRDLKIQCGSSCMSYAVNCDSSILFLENVEISSSGGQSAWAIGLSNSTVTFRNSIIKNCFDHTMLVMNSTLNIFNCSMSDNGAGIEGFHSNLNIENAEIDYDGITVSECSMNIQNSTISDNYGPGLRCINSHVIVINTLLKGNTGGGLNSSGSNVFLQNVTIADNTSAANGGGIHSVNDSSFVFDSIHRCNMYNNYSSSEGNDIYSNTFMEVKLDTFTVWNPSDIQAAPIENFSFDIMYGIHTPMSADHYVSPEGDNMNSGLTASEPLKNIYMATSLIIPDSTEPRTIHLLPGTYSQEASGECYPVQLSDYINLEGTVRDSTILSDDWGTRTKIEIKNTVSNSLSGFTINGSRYDCAIYCENSNPVLSDITVTESSIECKSSNPELSDMIISHSSRQNPGIVLDSSDAIMSNMEILENGNRGIYCSYSNPVISNSVISNNKGGIHLFHSDAVITDVEITDNEIRWSDPTLHVGAGICCEYSDPTLTNVNISRNMVNRPVYGKGGGGMYCQGSHPVLNNVEITENICGGTVGSDAGGGMYLSDSRPVFNEVTISGNVSDNYGGGVYCDTNCIVENVEIIGNSASTGGGLFIKGSPVIRDVVIRDNMATSMGGGISIGWNGFQYNNPVFDRVYIVSNSAKHYGGGIDIYRGSPNIRNSLIADNTIYGTSTVHHHGAGINIGDNSIPTFSNLTIANNSCNLGGGGIRISDESQMQVHNSILWNNEPDAISGLSSNILVSYSNIEGGWLGEGNKDTDPLFFGSVEHPYQLSQLSPCIDAGHPDTSAFDIGMYDLMGNYRLWDGDLDGDTIVDMGAYEFGSIGVGVFGSTANSQYSTVNVYPNPARYMLTIVTHPRTEPVSIEIIDIHGKVVTRRKRTDNNLTVNISKFPGGLYFIRLHTSKSVVVKKLMIQ